MSEIKIPLKSAIEPLKFTDDVIHRLSEIVWWNRNLTKLEDEEKFRNFKDILGKNLVKFKGPYIEYIPIPLESKDSFHDFSERTHLYKLLFESFHKNLFKERPNSECHLYVHQEEAFEAILNNNKDVVLSVPTSGGKTEAFLLPILQSCINAKTRTLNTIILYPMKALAVDQFNRLLRYLDTINKSLQSEGRFKEIIRIALWDGDTPEAVGVGDAFEGSLEENTPIRGLLCPRCGDRLIIKKGDILHCEKDSESFVWAHVTRKSIRDNSKSISILLTNPESLDYIFIHENQSTRSIVGERGENVELKNIVMDEAHTWKGIQGSHIRLLSRRLRDFYKNNNPKFILVSATIKNPKSLATDLIESDNALVIEAKPAPMPSIDNNIDFSRLSNMPSNFEDIFKSILIAYLIQEYFDRFNIEYPELKNSLNLCTEIKIVSIIENRIIVNEIGKEIVDRCGLRTKEEIMENIDRGLSHLLSQPSFVSKWKEHISHTLPEIIFLAKYISGDGKVLRFIEAKNILEMMKTKSKSDVKDFDAILATCLSIGRAAGLLTDKYHIFIKPNNKLFYCPECKFLSLVDRCSCGKTAFELKFCKKCHMPHMLKNLDEEKSLQDFQELEIEKDVLNKDQYIVEKKENFEDFFETFPIVESALIPIEKIPLGDHSYCAETKLLDPSVYYPSFVSYLLSILSRNTASNKVLSFCDSRTTSESIARYLMSNDYSISIQQEALRLILKNGNSLELMELRKELTKLSKKYFLDYYLDNAKTETSKEILMTMENQNIFPLGHLHNMQKLMTSSIITPKFILEKIEDNFGVIVAHELFKIFFGTNAKFSRFTIDFEGLTPEKALNKLKKSIKFIPADKLEEMFWNSFKLMIENKAIIKENINEIAQTITSSNLNEEKKNELIEYFNDQEKIVRRFLGYESSPLWRRDNPKKSELKLSIPSKVAFCHRCMSYFPLHDVDLKLCPKCGYSKINCGDRIQNGGKLPLISSSGWPLDHWANELLVPAFTTQELIHPVVGVHRAGIPMELRGLIEDGFRREPPKVNIISSTPTYELGIDIGTLDAIVQVGIPPTVTNYVQRSGRTGRIRGRPSYVFTILRNLHSVDNFYFENLDNYFKELKEIKIPDPNKLPLVKIPHIVTSALIFIARNTSPQIYKKLYEASNSNLESFCNDVRKYARIICQMVMLNGTNRFGDKLPSELKRVYNDDGLIKKIFDDYDSDINLSKRANIYFERVMNIPSSKKAQSSFANTNRWIGQWLSNLGYFSAYRGIGESIPISSEKADTIESKTLDRVIEEAFPGPLDKNWGAVFSLETGRWKVTKVTSRSIIDEVLICKTENCPLKYQAYPLTEKNCLGCGEETIKATIVSPDEIEISNRGIYYETFPIVSFYGSVNTTNESITSSVFKLKNKWKFGPSKATFFTAAFFRSDSKNEYASEAKLDRTVESLEIDEDFFEGKIKQESGHIGYSIESQGVELSFEKEEFSSLFREETMQAAVTIEQSIRKAVAIIAEVEFFDFSVTHSFNNEKVIIHIFDKREGGNGVSNIFWNEISKNDGTKLRQILMNIASCKNCSQFCDTCLLIERTSPLYLKNNMLDKKYIKMVIE